jgi:hypothetical protein
MDDLKLEDWDDDNETELVYAQQPIQKKSYS